MILKLEIYVKAQTKEPGATKQYLLGLIEGAIREVIETPGPFSIPMMETRVEMENNPNLKRLMRNANKLREIRPELQLEVLTPSQVIETMRKGVEKG